MHVYKIVTNDLRSIMVANNESLQKFCSVIQYKVGEFVEAPQDRPLMAFTTEKQAWSFIYSALAINYKLFKCEAQGISKTGKFTSRWTLLQSSLVEYLNGTLEFSTKFPFGMPPAGTIFCRRLKLMEQLYPCVKHCA